jgi:hypothetical protein
VSIGEANICSNSSEACVAMIRFPLDQKSRFEFQSRTAHCGHCSTLGLNYGKLTAVTRWILTNPVYEALGILVTCAESIRICYAIWQWIRYWKANWSMPWRIAAGGELRLSGLIIQHTLDGSTQRAELYPFPFNGPYRRLECEFNAESAATVARLPILTLVTAVGDPESFSASIGGTLKLMNCKMKRPGFFLWLRYLWSSGILREALLEVFR